MWDSQCIYLPVNEMKYYFSEHFWSEYQIFSLKIRNTKPQKLKRDISNAENVKTVDKNIAM